MHTILMVEDDVAIIDMVSLYLKNKEVILNKATNFAQAVESLNNCVPDIILLDWMLPDKSGIEFVKKIKANSSYNNIPVIMLTAKIAEEEIVEGLNSGADDYLTKPFSLKELYARIQAHLRRNKNKIDAEILEFGDIVLNRVTRRVFCGEISINLSDTEFKLLDFFITNPEDVHSRDKLLKEVWPKGIIVEDRSVDVYVLRLRKAMSKAGCQNYIQTIRNVGYRMSLLN